MTIWTLTIVETGLEEPAEIITDVFIDKEKAINKYNEHHDNWVNNHKGDLDILEDIDNGDYRNNHYIHGDGNEKIFLLESKEV